MNNLNRYNNFVNDVDEESWKSFINECLNSQCFGFDDFYKEFDFSKSIPATSIAIHPAMPNTVINILRLYLNKFLNVTF